jgi:hypothetical protein
VLFDLWKNACGIGYNTSSMRGAKEEAKKNSELKLDRLKK